MEECTELRQLGIRSELTTNERLLLRRLRMAVGDLEQMVRSRDDWRTLALALRGLEENRQQSGLVPGGLLDTIWEAEERLGLE